MTMESITMNGSLSIGDKIIYKPTGRVSTVIGFCNDGNIAITDDYLQGGFRCDDKEERNGFIWRFNENGKGYITYNNLHQIVLEADEI